MFYSYLKVLYICWNMIGNHEIKVVNNILPPLGKYAMTELKKGYLVARSSAGT